MGLSRLLLPAVSFKKIVRSFRNKEYAIDRTELLFLLAPGMVGLTVCVLLEIIMHLEYGAADPIYQESPLLFLIIPSILLLSLLPILYGIQLFQDMIDRNRGKNSRVILEKQVSSMQEQIAEMEHIHSGIRSMKHDMKNTLTVIMQLADKNGNAENTELHTYLSELNQTFDRLEFRFRTGNTVVDTLLSMKYHDIIRTIPDFRLNADKLLFPENLMIQSYDIGVILGNALDNAIEACKKQKEKKEEEEKVKEKKEEKMEQEEKLSGDTEKVSLPEEKALDITVKYVEANSEQEAKAMMQKEKLEDAYYPKFDVGIKAFYPYT